MEAKIPMAGFMAGLSRSTSPDIGDPIAVGLMGRVNWRRQRKEVGIPVAMVFLEWSDCRWWQWRGLLDASLRGIDEETNTVRRAAEGLAKPPHLGGWWSLGRRRGMQVRFEPQAAPEPAVMPLVH